MDLSSNNIGELEYADKHEYRGLDDSRDNMEKLKEKTVKDGLGKKREKILKIRKIYQTELKKNLGFFCSVRKPANRKRAFTEDHTTERKSDNIENTPRPATQNV